MLNQAKNKMYLTLRTTALLLPFTAMLPAALAANTASSSAFGESVRLNVAPVLGSPIQIASGPLPSVSGTAPAPYSTSNQVASVTVNSGGLIPATLTTGLLIVDAASNLPNSPGSTSDATVERITLTIANLVKLTATVIKSSAVAGGSCGALTATGSSVLTQLQLNGVTLNVSAAAPNTVLLAAAGIKIVLNEQIPSGNGTTDSGLTVNAIHVSIDNAPLGLGLLGGDVIIAQSTVSQHCSPGTADLAVSKFASPNSVQIGGALEYSVYVKNNGPDTATGVVMTDNLPANVTFKSVTPSQGSCTGTSTITCSLGSLASGGQAQVRIDVTVNGPHIPNTASATANEDDPNPSNNSATVTPTVN